MIWWFVILAVSTGVVLMAGIALYLRVRGHMKSDAVRDNTGDIAHQHETDTL
jgi:hypothetical protein